MSFVATNTKTLNTHKQESNHSILNTKLSHTHLNDNDQSLIYKLHLNWINEYKDRYRHWRYGPITANDPLQIKHHDIPTTTYWSILWQIEDYA